MREETHFLKGVVMGNERLRLGFMTNGFKRICGPSDDRLGREVIGGGGEEIGMVDGTGAWLGTGE
jgi:hypothetical protein